MSTETAPKLELSDYEAIEAAVLETERGRWFLQEYARRLRAAELQKLTDIVARLEVLIAAGPRPVAALTQAPQLALEAPAAQEPEPEATAAAEAEPELAPPPMPAAARHLNAAALSAIEALSRLSGQEQATLTA